MVPRSYASTPLPPLWGGAWCPHIFFGSRARTATHSPPPPPLRCPLPLPAGALISFRSAKIPIPTPSPAPLPPPAPGGGLKCISDNCTVFSPFPAPSPALAPVRPRPFAPPSHGARPSRQLGLPPPAPGGGIKSHHSHKKHLSSVHLAPTTCGRFFFLRAAVRLPALLLRRKAGRRAASWSVYGCAYHLDAIVKEV